jgi:hypothetical protein
MTINGSHDACDAPAVLEAVVETDSVAMRGLLLHTHQGAALPVAPEGRELSNSVWINVVMRVGYPVQHALPSGKHLKPFAPDVVVRSGQALRAKVPAVYIKRTLGGHEV